MTHEPGQDQASSATAKNKTGIRDWEDLCTNEIVHRTKPSFFIKKIRVQLGPGFRAKIFRVCAPGLQESFVKAGFKSAWVFTAHKGKYLCCKNIFSTECMARTALIRGNKGKREKGNRERGKMRNMGKRARRKGQGKKEKENNERGKREQVKSWKM